MKREAIRAILSVPNGSSVVVSLPTGAGKSLCAHLPALLMNQNRGISVMVVPTTALALDQEPADSLVIQDICDYIESCVANDGGMGPYPGEPPDGFETAIALPFVRSHHIGQGLTAEG